MKQKSLLKSAKNRLRNKSPAPSISSQGTSLISAQISSAGSSSSKILDTQVPQNTSPGGFQSQVQSNNAPDMITK